MCLKLNQGFIANCFGNDCVYQFYGEKSRTSIEIDVIENNKLEDLYILKNEEY